MIFRYPAWQEGNDKWWYHIDRGKGHLICMDLLLLPLQHDFLLCYYLLLDNIDMIWWMIHASMMLQMCIGYIFDMMYWIYVFIAYNLHSSLLDPISWHYSRCWRNSSVVSIVVKIIWCMYGQNRNHKCMKTKESSTVGQGKFYESLCTTSISRLLTCAKKWS